MDHRSAKRSTRRQASRRWRDFRSTRVSWLVVGIAGLAFVVGFFGIGVNAQSEEGADSCLAVPGMSDGVVRDRKILECLHASTGGGEWMTSTNWNSSAALGEWHGVTTDDRGRVAQLDLLGNELTGEIPSELGDLTNLNHLVLWDNELTGEIPSWLGSLTDLTHLHLGGNRLNGTIPSELGDLMILTSLVLSSNQISGTIPPELGDLTHLTELRLDGNELMGPIPSELGDLKNLTHLFLSFNRITGPIPSELGDLANLTELSLSDNWLTGPIPTELGDVEGLTLLYLAGNELFGCVPTGLGDVASNDFARIGLDFCEISPTSEVEVLPQTGGVGASSVFWRLSMMLGVSLLVLAWMLMIGRGGRSVNQI